MPIEALGANGNAPALALPAPPPSICADPSTASSSQAFVPASASPAAYALGLTIP